MRIDYPAGHEPTIWSPDPECPTHRFVLGRVDDHGRPLVVLAMNPSQALSSSSDRTVNRIIRASVEQGKAGWIVLNVYPQRASSPRALDAFDSALSEANCEAISSVLDRFKIDAVLGAWGNPRHPAIRRGIHDVRSMLRARGTRVYALDQLTKAGHPRHPRPQGRGDLPMLGPEIDVA